VETNVIIIRMLIPIPKEPIASVPEMQFHKWLPGAEEDAIVVQESNLTLKLYFDKQCTHVSADEIPTVMNVIAFNISADVMITGVPQDLIQHIRAAARNEPATDECLANDFWSLGHKVYTITVKALNRLLAYIRSQKGQYWLTEYAFDPGNMSSAFIHFKAKVNTGDGAWIRLALPNVIQTVASMPDPARLIEKEDWAKARQFVQTSGKTDFILELLAAAEAFSRKGESRVALTRSDHGTGGRNWGILQESLCKQVVRVKTCG
jgi:hypothetical protein